MKILKLWGIRRKKFLNMEMGVKNNVNIHEGSPTRYVFSYKVFEKFF